MKPASLPAVALGFLLAAGPATLAVAADAQGLDLTMEVIGKQDKVDDRIVNRIDVPGVLPLKRPDNAKARVRTAPPAPPTPQEYEAWVRQYREAQTERREQAWERYREWREQQQKK